MEGKVFECTQIEQNIYDLLVARLIVEESISFAMLAKRRGCDRALSELPSFVGRRMSVPTHHFMREKIFLNYYTILE